MTTISSISSPRESGFKSVVKRNPLISMYVLLFVLSWPGLLWEVLYSQGLVASQSPVIVSLFTGWGPGIAAVIVTAIIAGRAGVRELLGGLLRWRVALRWYAVAFFLLAAFILGGIGLHILFGGATPVIPAAGASPLQILLVFVVTVLFGFLINTEEIAWRGFAL